VRILYQHRTLADGAEGIHIKCMIEAFRSLGHEVRLVGAHPDQPVGRERAIARFRSAVPRAVFEAASVGLNASDYMTLAREFSRFRPHLLYKRHAKYDIGALLAARRRRVPSVLEVNSVFTAPEYEQFERLALLPLARRTERWSFELATRVVAVSTPLGRQVQALAPTAAVMVIPNGADPGWFDPDKASAARVRDRLGLGAAPTIGWTGVLREWHGLELLVAAFADVPGPKLLIVGDGPARLPLERRIAGLGLTQRVVITGRVPHEEVRDYIAAMDIAVVAHERTGIASPMKLLEYMSMARPVIAPRLANIADLIDDGSDGMLFEPGNARELSQSLAMLAGDRQRRQALGARARAKVVAERNWTHIAATIVDMIGRTA
jgi:glycosyltransferase involved in cell wall biosynthesis